VTDIAERLAEVRTRIVRACERAGREADNVTLVAVSKKHLAAAIDAAYRVGVTAIGESYAQELVDKFATAAHSKDIDWHFIGHLQRNKVKLVVGRAHLIHAVDSDRLATEIGLRATSAGVTQRVLVAVNVAGEQSKSGVAEGQAGALLDHIANVPGIECVGFMTMPPLSAQAEASRPFFRRLRQLRDKFAQCEVGKSAPLLELSMGTTGDFEVAIEEGATLVRVGTAVFGPRPQ